MCGTVWCGNVWRSCETQKLSLVFGRSFLKRFALCYRTVVCLSCPVCNVRVLWPNSLTDHDETWRAGRPRSWPHCVRWRPSSPSPKGAQPQSFGPYPLRPNGCIDQDAPWYGDRPRPRRLCVRWGSSPLNFRPMFIIVISLEHCTGVRRYWFVQVQVQV